MAPPSHHHRNADQPTTHTREQPHVKHISRAILALMVLVMALASGTILTSQAHAKGRPSSARASALSIRASRPATITRTSPTTRQAGPPRQAQQAPRATGSAAHGAARRPSRDRAAAARGRHRRPSSRPRPSSRWSPTRRHPPCRPHQLPSTGAPTLVILAAAVTLIVIGVLVIQAAKPQVQPTHTGSR